MASLAYWYDVRRWRRRSDDEPPDFLVSLGEEIPFEVRDEDGTINEDRTSDEDGTNDENETDDVDGTGEDDWQNDENT
jgi:hypothetical protein